MSAPAVTPAAVQAVLGTKATDPQILASSQTDTATQGCYYVQGGQAYPGKSRWCLITNTDSAATQGAAILVSLALHGNAGG